MPDIVPINRTEFARLIPRICAANTAENKDRWAENNPTIGHCDIVALWIQNLYGGELLQVSLEGTPFANDKRHYLNLLPNGEPLDLTAAQFGVHLFKKWQLNSCSRDELIRNGTSRERYARFGVRLLRAIFEAHRPLLRDEIYLRCLEQALRSPCQKKGVGAVLAIAGRPINGGKYNDFIPGLESLCQPTCTRIGRPTGTDALISACGHAEERLAFHAMARGHRTAELEIFVAGVASNGVPKERHTGEFTCIRCAIVMQYAGFAAVNVVRDNTSWARQTIPEALASALRYAQQQK